VSGPSPLGKGAAADASSSPSQDAGVVVGGLTPLSTVDWPGELAAVVFCQGCAWNCPYCHNAPLRPFSAAAASPGATGAVAPDAPSGAGGAEALTWAGVLDWLATRQGLLDAVVFSGGEPLLQPGLARAMRNVRGLGFKVGLHTSGMDPAALARVLPLTDWVGLDMKAPRAAYDRVTGRLGGALRPVGGGSASVHAHDSLASRTGGAGAAWASLDLVRKSGAAFELRTTWHPDLLSCDELTDLARELSSLVGVTWALQAFQPQGCADADLAAAGRTRVPGMLAEALRLALGSGVALHVRE